MIPAADVPSPLWGALVTVGRVQAGHSGRTTTTQRVDGTFVSFWRRSDVKYLSSLPQLYFLTRAPSIIYLLLAFIRCSALRAPSQRRLPQVQWGACTSLTTRNGCSSGDDSRWLAEGLSATCARIMAHGPRRRGPGTRTSSVSYQLVDMFPLSGNESSE